jgi:hypothetical protein
MIQVHREKMVAWSQLHPFLSADKELAEQRGLVASCNTKMEQIIICPNGRYRQALGWPF